jgi:uncharacterized membrane protein YfcA
MTAMSVWAWTLSPQLAAALAVFGALSGQVVAAVTVRRGFDVRTLAPFLAGGIAGLPIGLWLLPRLDAVMFKGLLGLLLVVLCPLMFFAARLPRIRRGGRIGDAVAGAGGGLMSGLGGFSGVVPTLWCQLRGFEKDAQRAVIQNFNLTMLAAAFGGFLWKGLMPAEAWPLLAAVVPAMLVPSLLGARLYRGLSDQGFRQVVLGLLTASGAAMLASSAPELWRRAGGVL